MSDTSPCRRGKRYARRWIPSLGKMVRVHRLVAVEMLGRPLMADEVVHHVDGNSLNNAPENLVVLPNQREHASLEVYIRRAKRGQLPLFPELIEATEFRRY
ncbi:HNH nuclease domain-containing protein [Deinococcus frigens]